MRLAGHTASTNAAKGWSTYPNYWMKPAKTHDCGHLMLSSCPADMRNSATAPRGVRCPYYCACQRSALSAHHLHLQLHIAVSKLHVGASGWQNWDPFADIWLLKDWNPSFQDDRLYRQEGKLEEGLNQSWVSQTTVFDFERFKGVYS